MKKIITVLVVVFIGMSIQVNAQKFYGEVDLGVGTLFGLSYPDGQVQVKGGVEIFQHYTLGISGFYTYGYFPVNILGLNAYVFAPEMGYAVEFEREIKRFSLGVGIGHMNSVWFGEFLPGETFAQGEVKFNLNKNLLLYAGGKYSTNPEFRWSYHTGLGIKF